MSGGGGFWQWLEARADRREARRVLLIDKGLDLRSLALRTFLALDAKLFIAAAIIGLFAWAFARNPANETFVGALIAGFAGAWGYYLGSSNSANQANERADQAMQLSHEAVRALPAPRAAARAASEVANAATSRAEDFTADEPSAESAAEPD